ncbi:MAG: CDP-alcohol phosphatidyltransferase family protein [Corallococcus sp.]|nr:CDP-alcohol phosphatidyltransferase family protein [Corallococcus sp.]MCM1359157.1 CDP-alcohol phosphatidyltransferase family protein [Corallococcus sp.]MCM1394547.1 CDP-alcohol phosphatidyltransferase family protein [Corallococcus sp.]
MNLPNKLTILRICMIPLFIAAYFLPFSWAPWVAVGIFVLAAFTDFLDGFIARKYHLVTDLGKLLDPIADKILVTSALFCITATNPLQWLSGYSMNTLSQFDWSTFGTIFFSVCATFILSRELLIDAVRMIAASKGKVVQANVFGKVKTVLQDVAIPVLVVCNVTQYSVQELMHISYRSASEGTLMFALNIVGVCLLFLATVMTVVSGIIYLVQNRSVFSATQNEDASAKTERSSLAGTSEN